MVRGAQSVSLLLFFVVLVAVVPAASAQKPRFTEKQRKQFIIRFPKYDANQDGNLDDAELLALRNFLQSRRRNSDFAPAAKDESQPDVDDGRWKTAGFTQANSMGRGAAAIPASGKFRVFVLMGQSNMHGTARARELKPPYTEKHERIRIWAHGTWEYFVPTQRFGPGVSFARQLAEFWPADTIGIIKIAIGGTGIRAFEKDWSRQRASLTFDAAKGSLYKDLMNAVTEARRISKPEFCGFVWKQGGADGTKKVLASEYFETFERLIADMRSDLEVPGLPVFVPSYTDDNGLIKAFTTKLSDEDRAAMNEARVEGATGENQEVQMLLKFLNDASPAKLQQLSGKRPYIAEVIAAQNRAGREIPDVITLFPGQLPKGADGIHYTAEGYITLGKITATAVQDYYRAKR